MTLVVGLLAVGFALAGDALAMRARALLPRLNRIAGVLMVVVGLYVGYYGLFELRLAEGGDPGDPVVSTVAGAQGVLVGWVSGLGPWPFVVVLAMLVVAGLLVAQCTRRASR
jgi:hypothetical protein